MNFIVLEGSKLDSTKPSLSLTCVDFWAVFTRDPVHYPTLGVHQHPLECVVGCHGGRHSLPAQHLAPHLRQLLICGMVTEVVIIHLSKT